jgi:DNA invertase Pin-like site-specific DNA recombinase
MPVRIAIYARVSTEDKGQDPENQLRQLRQWCADAGHTIAHEYIDRESGRKGAKVRKQFAQLFEDAHRRKFDCVLFGRWIASPARAWPRPMSPAADMARGKSP